MLNIQTGDKNSILRTKCSKVEKFNSSLKKFVEEMKSVMTQEDEDGNIIGVGLAANQVGKSLRILLLTQNVGTKKEKKILTVINPEILELSSQKVIMEEGCLSLPGIYAPISRSAKARVRWQNTEGRWCEKKFSDWEARIFLHEYDHLEGILFTDYLKKGGKRSCVDA